MTGDEPVVLEQFTMLAPLGIRFRDVVTGAVVDDGLSVVAYPPDNPARRVSAFTNRKGVFVFRGLPGLRDAENSAGDAEFWATPPKKRPFIVEVKDNEDRFLPAMLYVDAPTKGLYRWDETTGSPPLAESPVLLYSAPARPVLPAMAVVRADLWDPVLKRPAAWVLVEALFDGSVRGRGISSAEGRLLLMFVYPEPKDTSASPDGFSPPQGSLTRPVDLTWSLQLQAFYTPAAAVQEIPDLRKVFEQTRAALWFTLSPGVPLSTQTLKYGSELVLASQSRSELFITQLSSP